MKVKCLTNVEFIIYNTSECMFVEALIFHDHGIVVKPIWNGIPDFLPKQY